MKKILFLSFFVCFIFAISSYTAYSSRMVVSEDGSIQNRSVNLQKKYEEKKDEFQNSTQKYKETRENFLETKTRLQDKKDKASREELKKRSSEYLEKTGMVMEKYLESLQNRIQNMKFISENKKSEMMVKIEEDINIIKGKLGEIENAETIDEQKALVIELRLEWKDIKASSKNITGQIISAKLDYFISKMEMVSEGLQDRIDEMDNNAEKVALQNKIDNFDIKIDLAKSQNQLAQEKFSQINSIGEKNDLFGEGMQFVRSAHQYIKEAHKELLDITKEMRKEAINVKAEDNFINNETEENDEAGSEIDEGDDEERNIN